MERTGGCMCSAVRFTASEEPKRVTICHCEWCQRRTGSAFGTELVYDEARVEISGEGMTRHRHVSDESRRWLDVEFCGRCGTNLGFTLEAAPGIRTLPAGAFDERDWIRPDLIRFQHVFARSRQPWADLSSLVKVHEEYFR